MISFAPLTAASCGRHVKYDHQHRAKGNEKLQRLCDLLKTKKTESCNNLPRDAWLLNITKCFRCSSEQLKFKTICCLSPKCSFIRYQVLIFYSEYTVSGMFELRWPSRISFISSFSHGWLFGTCYMCSFVPGARERGRQAQMRYEVWVFALKSPMVFQGMQTRDHRQSHRQKASKGAEILVLELEWREQLILPVRDWGKGLRRVSM